MMDHFMSNGMIRGVDLIPLRAANQCAADIAVHKARGDFAIACGSGLSVPVTEETLPPSGRCSGPRIRPLCEAATQFVWHRRCPTT